VRWLYFLGVLIMPEKKDELLKIVREDLNYLENNWNDNATEDLLRISSTILRRLIVEGMLQRAWKEHGNSKEPIIRAPHFGAMLATVYLKWLDYAVAGGGSSKGIRFRFFTKFNVKNPPKKISGKAGEISVLSDFNFSLSEYKKSPCIYFRGTKITRLQLIRYICNTKGGAHFGKGKNAELKIYDLLDRLNDELKIANNQCVFYELLSMGQHLTSSVDIQKLYK